MPDLLFDASSLVKTLKLRRVGQQFDCAPQSAQELVVVVEFPHVVLRGALNLSYQLDRFKQLWE